MPVTWTAPCPAEMSTTSTAVCAGTLGTLARGTGSFASDFTQAKASAATTTNDGAFDARLASPLAMTPSASMPRAQRCPCGDGGYGELERQERVCSRRAAGRAGARPLLLQQLLQTVEHHLPVLLG